MTDTVSPQMLMQMPIQQLQFIKNQLEQELNVLGTSFGQLRTAQNRFQGAMSSLEIFSQQETQVMVPLTSSLYVPGVLSNMDKVIVDIGTGFLVEKSIEDAVDFYKRKIDFLKNQLDRLEETITSKRAQFQVFMDLYQTRISQAAAQVPVAQQ